MAITQSSRSSLPSFCISIFPQTARVSCTRSSCGRTSALIRSAATMAGSAPRLPPTPLLSGVLADFLEQLIGLDNRPDRSNTGHTLNGSTDRKRSALGDETRKNYSRWDRCASIKGIGNQLSKLHLYRPEGWKRRPTLDERLVHGIGTRSGGVVPTPYRRTRQRADCGGTRIAPASGHASRVHPPTRKRSCAQAFG